MNKFKLITICTAFLLSILGVVGFSNTLLFNSPSNNLIAEASNPAINIEQKCYLKETNQTCPMLDKQQASYIKPDQEFIYQIRLTNNTNSTIENLQMQIVNNNNVNISLINDLSNMRNLEQNQKAEYYLKGELSNSAKQSVITGETVFVQNTIIITTKSDILTNTSVQLVSNNQNNASQISFPTSLMSNKTTTSSTAISSVSNSQSNNLNSSESKTSSNTSSSSVINAISSANSSSLTSDSKSNLIKNNLLKIDLSCSDKQNRNQLCLDIKNDSDVTYRIQVTNSSDKNLTNSKLYIKHNIEQMVLDSKPNLNNSNQSNFGVKNNESDKELEIPLIKSNEKLEITFDSLLKISELQKTPIVTMIIVTNNDQSEPSILTYKIPQIANQKSSQTNVQNTNSSTSSSNVITERAKITNLSIATSSSNSSVSSVNTSSTISTTTNSNTINKTLNSTIATSSLSSSLLPSSLSAISKTSPSATVRTGAQENLVIFSSSFGIIGIMVLFLKKNLKKLHH